MVYENCFGIDTLTKGRRIMYCTTNYKTKKALKEAVKNGEKVTIYSPGIFPAPHNGRTSLEGPHYPKPHTWYADALIEDGIVVSVK